MSALMDFITWISELPFFYLDMMKPSTLFFI